MDLMQKSIFLRMSCVPRRKGRIGQQTRVVKAVYFLEKLTYRIGLFFCTIMNITRKNQLLQNERLFVNVLLYTRKQIFIKNYRLFLRINWQIINANKVCQTKTRDLQFCRVPLNMLRSSDVGYFVVNRMLIYEFVNQCFVIVEQRSSICLIFKINASVYDFKRLPLFFANYHKLSYMKKINNYTN